MKLSLTLISSILFTLLPFLLTAQQQKASSTTLIDHSRAFDRSGTSGFNPDWAPFYHGVASGDPLQDRVIIWTRVTPEDMNNDPIEVEWKVATDTELSNVVASGTFTTDENIDYTVKIDVTGLDAGTTYYYGFTALGAASLTGKTKTAPTGATVDHLKFGVVSCSNYQAGFFNAYHRLADRTDLDAIIHLGDYIYEYADGVYGDSSLFDELPLDPMEEIVTLEQYRARYSTYRLDTNLVRAHQQHPFIAVWDDHESANDAWTGGAENHDPDLGEGDWETRKSVSKTAYFEWMPIRENMDSSIYRTIRYGDLVDLIMIDTRLEGRDSQILDITAPELYSADRTLLGQDQFNWFTNELSQSTAKWKVIGNQVIFSELNVGWFAGVDPSTTFEATESLFLDIWDGYPAEREKILTLIEDEGIDNVVILTGDFHSSFAYDVTKEPVDLNFLGGFPFYQPSPTYDPTTGDGSVAVEFATPSISSANFDENTDFVTALTIQTLINIPTGIQVNDTINIGNPNPHMKYNQLIEHGYYILDITGDTAQADFFFSPIGEPSDDESFDASWFTVNAENHLQEADSPSAPKAVQDEPAPNDPPLVSNVEAIKTNPNLAILGVYPNPFDQQNTLHYALNKRSMVNITLLDAAGNVVKELVNQQIDRGVYSLTTDAADLANGIYVYRIEIDGNVMNRKVVVAK